MFLAVFLFTAWIVRDSGRWLKAKRDRQTTGDQKALEEINWEDLFQIARRTVQSTVAAFPDDLKAEAERLPYILKKWPPGGPTAKAMGHFIGFQLGRRSESNGPVTLYLGTIYKYCAERNLDFGDEVQTTYLHEFGHHLGYGENELTQRGLI